MEKLQEAAEENSKKYKSETTAFVSFIQGAKWEREHSKEVIEELVKALDESKEELNRCLPFVENTRQFYAVNSKIVMIDELIQKHRNNEK